jgi:lysophospholipase L1-like esterase
VRVAKLTLYSLSIAMVALTLTAAAAGASVATVSYIALGDSYSSGEGNGPFDGRCHRAASSDAAYPKILPGLVGYVGAPEFRACTGAKTADIWNRPQPGKPGQLAQVEYVDGSDRLATITIGGNDLGFAPVLARCLLPFDCSRSNAAAAVNQRLGTIRADLANVYRRIRSRMHSAGYLVVAGYPHLFADDRPIGCQLLISRAESTWIDSAVDRANAEIEAAVRSVRASNGNVVFVNVVDDFAGHELCTKDEWLYGLTLSPHEGVNLVQGSYHPNRGGHRAYAGAIARVLRSARVRAVLTGRSPQSACSASSPGPGSWNRAPRHRAARLARSSTPVPACRPADGARP